MVLLGNILSQGLLVSSFASVSALARAALICSRVIAGGNNSGWGSATSVAAKSVHAINVGIIDIDNRTSSAHPI